MKRLDSSSKAGRQVRLTARAGKIEVASKSLTRTQAARFIGTLAQANLNPRTELRYGNRFQLLVAVVLSAQATDRSVNRVTKDLFQAVRSPLQMLALGEAELRQRIRTIGLFRSKAANIIKLAQQLLDRHQGRVPGTRATLEALSGVGRKTASVVLNSAFGQETIAVDTHIFRVANRTGLALGRHPRAVEEALLAILPKSKLRYAHHWLLLHGRYVCVARRPKCRQCPVASECNYPAKAQT